MFTERDPNNLLQDAAKRGDLEGIKDALLKGADINSTTRYFLHAAYLDTERKYLNDSDSEHSDQECETEEEATWAGGPWNHSTPRRYRVVEKVVPPCVRAGDFYSPLDLAAYNGHYAAIQLLCDRGANPNLFNLDRKTPCDIATERGRFDLSFFLIERGANITYYTFVQAISKKNLDFIKFLISKGVIVSDGIVREAVYQDCREIAQFLLLHVKKGENWADRPGIQENANCLAIALEKGWDDVVVCFVQAGVNVNGNNKQGQSALEIAVRRGSLSMIHCLYSSRKYISTIDKACYIAAGLGGGDNYRDIVAYLLSRGANLLGFNLQDAHFSFRHSLSIIKSQFEAASKLDFFSYSWDGLSIPTKVEEAHLNACQESQNIFHRLLKKELRLYQPFRVNHQTFLYELTRNPVHQRIFAQKVIAGQTIYLAAFFAFDEAKIEKLDMIGAGSLDGAAASSEPSAAASVSFPKPSAAASVSFPKPSAPPDPSAAVNSPLVDDNTAISLYSSPVSEVFSINGPSLPSSSSLSAYWADPNQPGLLSSLRLSEGAAAGHAVGFPITNVPPGGALFE